jgi:hypothetical protein
MIESRISPFNSLSGIGTQDSQTCFTDTFQATFVYVYQVVEKVVIAVSDFFIRIATILINTPCEWANCLKLMILRSLTSLIIPAMDTNVDDEKLREFHYSIANHTDAGFKTSIVNLTVATGVEISGVELVKNESQAEPATWIVYFLPNAGLLEDMYPRLVDLHKLTNANIVCYNYRCCGKNKVFPVSEEELVQDGSLIIETILKRAKPEHVLVHGYSFGGGIATQVVGGFAEENIHLALCNERSFRSLAATIIELFPCVIGTLLAQLATYLGWQLNSEEALKKLKNSAIIVLSCVVDGLIQTNAQFIQAVRDAKMTGIIQDSQVHEITMIHNSGFDHARHWKRDESRQYANFVSTLLN